MCCDVRMTSSGAGCSNDEVIMVLINASNFNSRILVQVKLIEGPTDAKLQVVTCWATPTQGAINADIQYPLIKD